MTLYYHSVRACPQCREDGLWLDDFDKKFHCINCGYEMWGFDPDDRKLIQETLDDITEEIQKDEML